MPMEGI